ncbi:MAG: class I SAM-dependent methyltransferase [Aquabacterium sp.]|nr:class I SAM-dependent methyltransferase [Aquabacterium sp.]
MMFRSLAPTTLRYFLGEWLYEIRSLRRETDHSSYLNGLGMVRLKGKSCPICGAWNDVAIRFAFPWDQDIQKYLCIDCRHLYAAYDYDFIASESYDFKPHYPRGEARLGVQALRALPKIDGARKILFIGSGGNQGLLDAYLPTHAEAWYSDLKQVRPCRFIPVATLAQQVEKFDAVVTRAVLEHIDDPKAVIKGWLSVLKDGGIMAHSFPSLIHNDLNNMMVGIRSHTSIFSERSLNLLALELGLKQVMRDKFFLKTGHTHPSYFFQRNGVSLGSSMR